MNALPYRSLALVLVLVLVLAVPAIADTPHNDMSLACTNSPTTANTPTDFSCTFDFNDGGSFGNTANDKVAEFSLAPEDLQANHDEQSVYADGEDDPDDGQKVGQVTVRTELSYNLCDDNNNDGGTYSMYWEDTWRAYTPPAGWTKVAEYNTVVTIALIFTENVPTHVLYHATTGQHRFVTDLPEARACDGAHTKYDPLTIYSHENNNSASEWVIKNPPDPGTYNVELCATEVGGSVHCVTSTYVVT